jgi:hypothetical protein
MFQFMEVISTPHDDTMSWDPTLQAELSGPKVAAIKAQAWYLAFLSADRPMINRLPGAKSTTFYAGQRPRPFFVAGGVEGEKGQVIPEINLTLPCLETGENTPYPHAAGGCGHDPGTEWWTSERRLENP